MIQKPYLRHSLGSVENRLVFQFGSCVTDCPNCVTNCPRGTTPFGLTDVVGFAHDSASAPKVKTYLEEARMRERSRRQ